MGITEIILILVVALIVVGPEGLPDFLRAAGKIVRELQSAGNTVMRELTEAVDEPRRALNELNPLAPNSGTRSPRPNNSGPEPKKTPEDTPEQH